MKLSPAPAFCLIEPQENTTSPLYITQEGGKYLKSGKIVKVGGDEITEAGVKLPSPAKIGEKWYFLTYNDDVDHLTIEGTLFYIVKFGDLRFKYED